MLHEYAVEPRAVVSDWQTFRFLLSQFGFDKGKLISQFPKRWFRDVYDAAAHWPDGRRKARMFEMLRTAKGSQVVRFGRPYDPRLGGWLDNAVAQHAVKPFRAMIAEENPNGQQAVLICAEVDALEPLMQSPHAQLVPRVGSELADAMAPMLKSARTLLFVDRYFDVGRPSYLETLKACLDVVREGGRRPTRCEIHFCDHESRPSLEEAERVASERLFGVVPEGVSLALYAWREKPGGEDFHARDLLTDVGGINVEAGFSAEGEHQNVQLALLTSNVWQTKLRSFERGAEVYDLVAPVIEVWRDGRVRRR